MERDADRSSTPRVPCGSALASLAVPAKRFHTRVDLHFWLEKAREELLTVDAMVGFKEVASRCGLSAFHFARLFRETYGLTPGDYRKKCLMERAKGLLRTLSVGEVAAELGYGSTSTFSRAFRREVGVCPSEFVSQKPID